MAVVIPLNSITPECLLEIRNALIIYKKKKFIPTPKGKRYKPPPDEPPVCFFVQTVEHIRIPYCFSICLLRRCLNLPLPHVKTRLSFNGTLREKQILPAQESTHNLKAVGSNTLILPPGYGKTVITSWVACAIDYVTVILVHRLNIMRQWINTFNLYTNAVVWVVGNRYPSQPFNIIICMKDRATSIPEEIRDQIGFLVIDEAHRFCTPSSVEAILAFRPRHVMVCTATLERPDGLDAMAVALCGKHRVERKFEGHFYYRSVATGLVVNAENNPRTGRVDFDKLLKEIFHSEVRNEFIVNLVKANPSRKIMIITTYVKEHAKPLHQLMVMRGVAATIFAGDEDYVDSNVCVVSVGKGGEGFDPAALCEDPTIRPFDMLILVTSFKAENLLEQVVGRVLRAGESVVLDVYDEHPTLVTHNEKRTRWYRKYGGIEF